MSLKIYKKSLNYSYALGIFPTIELLTSRPKDCIGVLISKEAEKYNGVDKVRQLCLDNDINFDIADKAINKIAKKEKTKVMGVLKKYDSKLILDQDHLVLVNPSLPGNFGTIIRTAVGFDVNNIAVIKPASDIFDPKVIRASMGAVFKINFGYYASFDIYTESFSNNTIYPFTLSGKNKLIDTKFENPASLIFGNEGQGLDNTFDRHNTSVKINHTNKIDSLNLATAAGIALHSLYNQRRN